MSEFLGEDFLLDSDLAKELYHHHSETQPIFDFHCHLQPREIYEDRKFANLTECWLVSNGAGDHYKWRLMREFGIDERYITGSAPAKEKFLKYAEIMPYLLGNPIYEWTHLELRRFFGISDCLSPKTAEAIWDSANAQLTTLTARKMMLVSHVETVFTTDDPVDDLRWHEALKKEASFPIQVLPCFRPDKALNIERDSFLPWLKALEAISGGSADTLNDLLDLLSKRLAFFVDHGCAASDHALDRVCYRKATYEEANAVYQKGRRGETLTREDEEIYKGYVLLFLGRLYNRYHIVQQYHIGALRNVSSRAYQALGCDAGYDVIGDDPVAAPLGALLNELDRTNELPKTVLYALNTKDYPALVALMNAFQGGEKGKIQLGSAWWFNDHYDGIHQQLSILSADGLLSCFIGMLTDSRSFLSYPRHEYFRRELCQFVAHLVEQGRYPNDPAVLGEIVEAISYRNAKAYFKR